MFYIKLLESVSKSFKNLYVFVKWIKEIWVCNLCNGFILSGQVRYKSYEYKAFDLCESCYLKERSAQSQLFKNGMFLPEKEHRFQIKKRVDANFSNQTLNNVFVEYSQRPCFGTLNIEKKKYEWVSYGLVHQRVLNFAAGLVSVVLIKDKYDRKERDFISICGKNSMEWLLLILRAFIKKLSLFLFILH
jgi:hypothetical protein